MADVLLRLMAAGTPVSELEVTTTYSGHQVFAMRDFPNPLGRPAAQELPNNLDTMSTTEVVRPRKDGILANVFLWYKKANSEPMLLFINYRQSLIMRHATAVLKHCQA